MSASEALHDEGYDYESLPPSFSWGANMLAGAFAGILEHTAMYPVDLLKTRMQVMNPSPTAIYDGISHAIVTITRREGMLTLWRGISSVAIGAGPAHAVHFTAYEKIKDLMGGGGNEHHPIASFSAGVAAAIGGEAIMNPFDVIKQRMQLQGSQHHSIVSCARTVWRAEGLRAFYISYPTSISIMVPFNGLQILAYDSISKFWNPTGKYDPVTHCGAGALAGGFAAAATTPLDVIKTTLQTRGSAVDADLRNVSGIRNAAAVIFRREGMSGFFRGIKPRVLAAMPATAICWSGYEVLKAAFLAQAERQDPQ